MDDEIEGSQINQVLRLVKSLSDDGEVQLTILGIALVVACKSCGVGKDSALETLEEIFDRKINLIPMSKTAQ